jgi:hypothetical protein
LFPIPETPTVKSSTIAKIRRKKAAANTEGKNAKPCR